MSIGETLRPYINVAIIVMIIVFLIFAMIAFGLRFVKRMKEDWNFGKK